MNISREHALKIYLNGDTKKINEVAKNSLGQRKAFHDNNLERRSDTGEFTRYGEHFGRLRPKKYLIGTFTQLPAYINSKFVLKALRNYDLPKKKSKACSLESQLFRTLNVHIPRGIVVCIINVPFECIICLAPTLTVYKLETRGNTSTQCM